MRTLCFESANQPRIKIFSRLVDTNITEEVENDQDKEKLRPNQSQTCHPNANYGELLFSTASVLFPEITKLPSALIFLHMDFNVMDSFRLSAFGSQDGWFGVFAVDMKLRTVVRSFNLSHESPITSIKIFQHISTCVSNSQGINNADEKSTLLNHINCLVCSAFEPSVVYRNIFEPDSFGMQNQLPLPCSMDFDHVNCASVGDFNVDGKPEIILGTFGQRLLYYEWDCSYPESNDGHYVLKAQRELPGPVFSISPPLDLIGEGPLSLAVLTSRGLHVFQHDIQHLIKEIHRRLDKSFIWSVYSNLQT
ncbi:unnamed protein product [Heterobilharzia americana]|nr:unnamed protein product [Heterobilharzia americana]